VLALKPKPDVIAGDFNADTIFTESLRNYPVYQKAKEEGKAELYQRYAFSGHDRLKRANFKSSRVNYTSLYGGTVDWIYYNTETIKLVGGISKVVLMHQIDNYKCVECLSDHDGVYAKLKKLPEGAVRMSPIALHLGSGINRSVPEPVDPPPNYPDPCWALPTIPQKQKQEHFFNFIRVFFTKFNTMLKKYVYLKVRNWKKKFHSSFKKIMDEMYNYYPEISRKLSFKTTLQQFEKINTLSLCRYRHDGHFGWHHGSLRYVLFKENRFEKSTKLEEKRKLLRWVYLGRLKSKSNN